MGNPHFLLRVNGRASQATARRAFRGGASVVLGDTASPNRPVGGGDTESPYMPVGGGETESPYMAHGVSCVPKFGVPTLGIPQLGIP